MFDSNRNLSPSRTEGSQTKLVRIKDYPQLQSINWNRSPDAVIDGHEALLVYERNWRYVDQLVLESHEKKLIAELTRQFGNGVFLV